MHPSDPTAAQLRSRKRKAVLAGGAVLGLGATMTLAAWTDNVWVGGSFSAGKFNVQGSVDGGTTWSEYATSATAGPLAFTLPVSAMSPGDSAYGALALRVDPAANSYGAAISIPTAPAAPAAGNAANTAFFTALRVSVFAVAPASCTATGTASATPVTGLGDVPMTTTSAATVLTLNKNSTVQGLCFKVTLPTGAASTVQGGTTGALTWNLNAASV